MVRTRFSLQFNYSLRPAPMAPPPHRHVDVMDLAPTTPSYSFPQPKEKKEELVRLAPPTFDDMASFDEPMPDEPAPAPVPAPSASAVPSTCVSSPPLRVKNVALMSSDLTLVWSIFLSPVISLFVKP